MDLMVMEPKCKREQMRSTRCTDKFYTLSRFELQYDLLWVFYVIIYDRAIHGGMQGLNPTVNAKALSKNLVQ